MAVDSAVLMNLMMNNMFYIVGILGVLVLVMYVIIINLFLNLSYLKKRYKKMMTGVDSGLNLERMLMGHIDEVREAINKTAAVEAENKITRQLLISRYINSALSVFARLRIWAVISAMLWLCWIRQTTG